MPANPCYATGHQLIVWLIFFAPSFQVFICIDKITSKSSFVQAKYWLKCIGKKHFVMKFHLSLIIFCKNTNILMSVKHVKSFTKRTVKLKKLEHSAGSNWFAKFSSPRPNFPCRPSPKVNMRPFSVCGKKKGIINNRGSIQKQDKNIKTL